MKDVAQLLKNEMKARCEHELQLYGLMLNTAQPSDLR